MSLTHNTIQHRFIAQLDVETIPEIQCLPHLAGDGTRQCHRVRLRGSSKYVSVSFLQLCPKSNSLECCIHGRGYRTTQAAMVEWTDCSPSYTFVSCTNTRTSKHIEWTHLFVRFGHVYANVLTYILLN